MPESVNDILLDKAILRQVHTIRYRNGVVSRMLATLERADASAIGRLSVRLGRIESRGYDLGPATTERLERIIVDIQATRSSIIEQAGRELTEELTEYAALETTWQMKLLTDTVTTVGLNTTAPTISRVRSAALKRPFQTRLLKDWIKDLNSDDRRRVRYAVSNGIVEGRTTPQIASEIQEAMDITKRHATSIARTATNHVANAARTEVGIANADIIKGVQFIATLDSRTTQICRINDKKVFPVDSGPRAPLHIGCRSTQVFILKGVPGNTGTRASFNGQVAGDLSYGEWLRKQPASFQDEVLGVSKGKIFRQGKLKIERFSDKSGREYTLDELRKREPEAYKLAKVG